MKRKRILIIVQTNYIGDSRVRKIVNFLKQYYELSIICLNGAGKKFYSTEEEIEMFRIPDLRIPTISFVKNELLDKILDVTKYLFEYVYFTLISTFIFLFTLAKNKYDAVHINNPPDTLCVIALLGKVFSVKCVYDLHDLSPELYLARSKGERDLIYKILLYIEKLSCKIADKIICVNDSCREIILERHQISPNKILIIRNDPVISKGDKECLLNGNFKRKTQNDKKTILFLGAINPQDGVELLLESIHYLVNQLGKTDFICNIVGGGDSLEEHKMSAEKLNLDKYVNFTGFINDRKEVIRYLNNADICVESAPFNEPNNVSSFVKIMEYMAAAKPIVAFDMYETRFSTDGSAILVPPNDVKAFSYAIKELLEDPILRENLGKIGMKRIKDELNWESASINLMAAYKSLFV